MRGALKTKVAAPAIVGRDRNIALNRQDYLHETSLKRGRFGRKDAESDIVGLQGNVKSLTEAMKKRDEELVAAVKAAHEQAKDSGKIAGETLTELKKLAEDSGKIQARLLDVEQKMAGVADLTRSRKNVGKSSGVLVTEHEDFKALALKKHGTINIQLKAISSVTTGAGAAGDLVAPDRLSTIIRPFDRRMTIVDLISRGRTASNLVEYVQETGFTNAAAPVPEQELKPESDLSFELRSTGVKTIAHIMVASKQILDDAPMLESYIDGRLRFGLDDVLERQVLAGDGTGDNLLGLIPEATPYNRPDSQTRIDVIRRSITQVRLSEMRADSVVLHPSDWEEIELTKTTQGEYVWANPFGLLNPTIWGLAVVDTTVMDEGDFLTGAFKLAATFWDRENANVQLSTEDSDNFRRNKVTIRGELRGALVVWRPEALVFGDFADAISN